MSEREEIEKEVSEDMGESDGKSGTDVGFDSCADSDGMFEGWEIPNEWIAEEEGEAKVAEVDEVWGVGEEETKKIIEEIKRKREDAEDAESGLRRCMVCGKEAEVRKCGYGKKAIFVGCWETRECARRSVYREDGDVVEASKDWNRRNGIVGVVKGIERILYWMDRKVSKESRKLK